MYFFNFSCHLSRYKELVASHVQSLLDKNNDHITSKDLIDLENLVIRDIKNKVTPISRSGRERPMSALEPKKELGTNQESSFHTQNHPSTIPFLIINERSDSSPMLSTEVEGHEWDLIAAYDKLKSDERTKREEDELKMKKSQLKISLERQIEEAKALKLREKEIRQQEAERIKRDMELHEQDKFAKTLEVSRRHEEERFIREQQIKEQRERREAEERAIKASEMAEIHRLNEVRRKECEASIQKRQEDLRHREEYIRANDELRRIKDLQKKKELEEERRLMEAYRNKVQRESIERVDRNRQRHAAIDNNLKNYEQHESTQSKLQRERLLDEQILREAEKKDEERHRDELKRIEERRLKEVQALSENLELRQKREMDRKANKEEEKEYISMIRNESEKYFQSIAEQQAAEAEKQKRYRDSLLSQIQSQRNGANRSGVAHADHPTFDRKESALNVSIMKKILSDKELFAKVQEECRSSRRPASAGATRRNPLTGRSNPAPTPGAFSAKVPTAESPNFGQKEKAVAWM